MQTPFFFLCLVAAAVSSACARLPTQPELPGEMIDRAGLQADVDLLQRTYETLHPGLYRYNTPARMHAAFADLRRALDRPQSTGAAYLAFSRFAAKVECGHTYANFYNQTGALQDALLKRSDRVPFHFRWLGERMIVTRNFSTEARLVPGTEIASIDGVPVRRILQTLMTIARADGANDAKRVAWLEVQGAETFEAFDVFLPLFYPAFGTDFDLEVHTPAGDSLRVTVAATTYAQRLAQMPARSADSIPWSLAIGRDGIAVMRMPTWALYENSWDWKAWLDDAFRRLQAAGVATFVVDLRGNEGGLSIGDALLAHLTDRDVVLNDTLRLVRYRKVPDDLLPHLETWDHSFADWGAAAVAYDDRFLRLTRYDNAPAAYVIHPAAPRFAGAVYVLVGPTNSSATFEFAETVKATRLATLVGRTTGGNRRGINGGAFFFLRLPNSAIELDVPLIGQFPREAQPDGGIAPDIPVATTIADIAAGVDSEMRAVRNAALRNADRGRAFARKSRP